MHMSCHIPCKVVWIKHPHAHDQAIYYEPNNLTHDMQYTMNQNKTMHMTCKWHKILP